MVSLSQQMFSMATCNAVNAILLLEHSHDIIRTQTQQSRHSLTGIYPTSSWLVVLGCRTVADQGAAVMKKYDTSPSSAYVD